MEQLTPQWKLSVQVAIDDMHGALIALGIVDCEGIESARAWLSEHKRLSPHTMSECPVKAVVK